MPNSILRVCDSRWQVHVRGLSLLVALSALGSCFLRTWPPAPIARDASWPTRCPNCASPQVAKILYGYLDFDQPRIERALKDGVIAAGGCGGGGPTDPRWRCGSCRFEWGGVAAEQVGPAFGATGD